MADTKSTVGAVDSGNRRSSDERNSLGGTTTTANRTGQPQADRNSRDSRGAANEKDIAPPRSSEGEKESSGTEHDPLSPGRGAERKAGDDNGGEGGNQPESVEEEKKADVEHDNGEKGDDEGGGNLLAGTNELLADTAGGDSGRFQGMRSRMKKAGKGLLTKKSPTSSAGRRKGTDDAALGATSGKEGQQSEAVERTSSGDTLPDAGSEGLMRQTGGAREDKDGGGRNLTEDPADGSDTARCASCPRLVEVFLQQHF